jgi:hypothetical protein
MKLHLALISVALALAAATGAEAAVGTTCLCRSDDGKTFKERTLRHHRWACDYRLGYTKGDPGITVRPRPAAETCNMEEVIQFKVYMCISNGCTYAYSKAAETPNKELEKIEVLKGKRRP